MMRVLRPEAPIYARPHPIALFAPGLGFPLQRLRVGLGDLETAPAPPPTAASLFPPLLRKEVAAGSYFTSYVIIW